MKPLFVYGTLMPGELAFGQIAPYIDRFDRATIESAVILLRDGLPALKMYAEEGYSHRTVDGYLLYSKSMQPLQLIEIAKSYEGTNYKLVDAKVKDSSGSIQDSQTFAGAKPEQSNPELWEGSWSTANSPLLGYGYPYLLKSLKFKDPKVPEHLGPGNYWKELEYWCGKNSWPGLLRIEGDFLTLTSIFEYVLSLRFGSTFGKEVMKRIGAVVEEPEMQQAFANIEIDEIWDVRNVTNIGAGKSSPTNLKKAIESCYDVRNNLSHRGKSVKSDAVKVINATKLLSNLLTAYLLIVLPALKEVWPKEIWDKNQIE